ncbi:acetate/propionate family kinase [Herminiimonas sp. CN]|uniref:acetate/propionate family kinase n=1 Tax=Herminiimonas sp. CN TaxID=1349818 RepID=UPI0004736C3C|nr:acetate/propionate family kinase [Herminiimonas sp. CN]
MKTAHNAILAVNAGSSSLKFALYPQHDHAVDAASLTGIVEGLQPGGTPRICVRDGSGETQRLLPPAAGDGFDQALAALQAALDEYAGSTTLAAIAHRIVHGGERYAASIVLDAAALDYLASLATLAPLHQPHNLAGVAAFRRAYPALPQVGCFDTGFHATIPVVEQLFALPQALRAAGIRRYGFHGLSYRYVAGRLTERSAHAGGKALLAHLGNGASACAMLDGKSIATSMGFSTLDGLMMGTRSGTLDPGVLLYLMRQGWDLERIERTLYRESGLCGVSGISADMRALRASDQPDAALAIALFTHRLVKECGALAACLCGLDLLAFTGGIGEHDAALRQASCERLQHLGVAIDAGRNRAATGSQMLPIHAPGSRAEIWVVPTDEGRIAAGDAARLCRPY